MIPLLNAVEARVLGCLIEKGVTTPEYYPLTLNALTMACNQKSNRDPVMQVTEEDVVRALDGLRQWQLAGAISMAGSRVPKYQQYLEKVIPLNPRQVAVLCELLVRGPQTAGELRGRAARLAEFSGVAEVEIVLQELSAWDGGPLVSRLPRQSGQREERFYQRLCGEIEAAPAGPAGSSAEPPPEPARLAVKASDDRVGALEKELAGVKEELASLKARFENFERQFR